MVKPSLRIAILECDTPLGKVKDKYGTYGAIFKILLGKGADALGQPDLISSKHGLELSSFDVVSKQEYPDLLNIDAVLLTGSKHSSFDNDPWILKLVDFTKKVLQQDRVRVIGVCFGHQILGRALGVPVGKNDKGWEVSVLPMELTPKAKELFKQDALSLHQMHRDIVYEYPENVEPLGASPLCSTQGMYRKGHFISVQGHPEFNDEIVTEIVENRHRMGIFPDDVYHDALTRVGNRHDGVPVSQAFLRFLLED